MSDVGANKLASKIRGNKYPGSSLINGKVYHELPFPGFEGLPSHRHSTRARWNHISKYVSVNGKSVLDLGCSVGAFSILSSLSGASKVLGVDYDKDSIELARYTANKVGAKNIEFKCCKIDSTFLEEVDYFDVIIWLSHWMWIVKQLGMAEAKRLLHLVSKKSSLMIFESAADDGRARIKGMTQEGIENIFKTNTCYTKVKNIGITPGWKKRNILIGEI